MWPTSLGTHVVTIRLPDFSGCSHANGNDRHCRHFDGNSCVTVEDDSPPQDLRTFRRQVYTHFPNVEAELQPPLRGHGVGFFRLTQTGRFGRMYYLDL